jgi:diadenosine tetraphosphate (Ap4A) HIT family hydrolase
MMNSEHCQHCRRVELANQGQLPSLLHMTDQVIVIAGDHQYFRGYCIAIAKTHIREMHNISSDLALMMFGDVLAAGRRIDFAFKPLKMNYASLGNVDEHLHWHIIPRYRNEPDCKDHPWKNADKFSTKPTTDQDIKNLRLAFATT